MTGGVQTRVNCLHLCWKERDAERKKSSSKSGFKDSHLQTDENYLKIVT